MEKPFRRERKRQLRPMEKAPPRRPPLPREAIKFLQPGEQTAITKPVVDYAQRFPGKSFETAKAIVDDLVSFKRQHFPRESIGSVYAKRTAGEILESRRIAVIGGNTNLGHTAAIAGCIDYNVALCAALRAKGIPAKFVRIKTHSLTHFFVEGKWFEADPTSGIARIIAEQWNRRGHRSPIDTSKLPLLVKPIDSARAAEIEKEKWRGAYAEGLDAWGVGIRSLEDFGKYWR